MITRPWLWPSAALLLLGALTGCGDQGSPPPDEPEDPTSSEASRRVPLMNHRIETPTSWQRATGATTERVEGRDCQRFLHEQGDRATLEILLPWPARKGSAVELTQRGREGVLRMTAAPTPFKRSDAYELAYTPKAFTLEGEAMERSDDASVSHAATLAALIALPDGAGLAAELPPFSAGSTAVIIGRSAGDVATPPTLDVEWNGTRTASLTTADQWGPMPTEIPTHIPADDEASHLRLVARIADGTATAVLKRVEFASPIADRLWIRGAAEDVSALDARWAAGDVELRVVPQAPRVRTTLRATDAWGRQETSHEHIVYLLDDEVLVREVPEQRLAWRGPAPLVPGSDAPDGFRSWIVDQPGRYRVTVPGDADAHFLQPAAAMIARLQKNRLPEPRGATGAPEPLHRLELGRERRVTYLLAPGEALRFQLPADAPRTVRWSWSTWTETAQDGGAIDVTMTCDGADVASAHGIAKTVNEASWTNERHALPAAGDVLEIRFDGPASTLGPNGRFSPHFCAVTPPVLIDMGQRPGGVIIYCIDTLRRDHMQVYGYERDTTPTLSALSSELVLFEESYSACSWTRPSTASLLTGLHPRFHGAWGENVLAHEVETLAERFHAEGYATGAVVTNPNVSGSTLGFEEGFDNFHAAFGGRGDLFDTWADEFHPWIEAWLAEHAHEPFFLYIHSVDPHSPYTPPEADWRRYDETYDGSITGLHEGPGAFESVANPTDEDVAHLVALYDAEIRINDAALGRLEESLRDLQLWDDTGWVITSDHGEEFQERGGWLHGRRAYQEQLAVPLLMKPAERWEVPPHRSIHRSQIIDIAPTLLTLEGFSPSPTTGDSLDEILRGGAEPEPTRTLYFDEYFSEPPQVETVLTNWDKMIFTSTGDRNQPERVEWYNLTDDPGETKNLTDFAIPEDFLRFRSLIVDFDAAMADRGLAHVAARGARFAVSTQEEIDALLRIGYLMPTTPPEQNERDEGDASDGE